MKIQSNHICLNCGNPFHGKFCNECGEKVLQEEDKKVSHLLHEGFHFLTHFDSKFFKTLKLIFVNPGLVSKEFTEGKRKKYYSPFSLFLVAVFLYLLFPTLQGLNISFYNHIHNNSYIGIHFPQKWASAKMLNEHTTFEHLAEKFDHLSPKLAKILLIVLIPFAALILKLLFRRRKTFFYDHFIFASEYLSFFILFVFFLLPVVFELLGLLIRMNEVGDSNLAFVVVQIGAIWLVAGAGIRRFYNVTVWKAAFLSLLFLLLLLFVIFFIYRWMLFAIVMLII